MKKNSGKSNVRAPRPGSKKGFNTFAMVITAFVIIIAGILLIDRLNEPAPSVIATQPAGESPGAGGTNSTSAPDFELTSVDGGSITLADYEGKVLMLNFWATWCGPCKKEIPDFIEIQDAFRDRGLEILGVSLDDPKHVAAVADFVRDHGINYDVVYGNGDIAQAYGGVRSIPTTFLINRSGEIVSSEVGLRPKSAWISEIEALL
ncbi:MAG: TlpA family protein disulfide reductase [Bacteroidetes bacterium]|nr:TlpA family protein disulfide reductase [Bacteroidota bacterium]